MNLSNRAGAHGWYSIKCHGADGVLKWEDVASNLVMSEGLQDINTNYFLGSAYTAVHYFGLVTGPGNMNTYAAGDTLASHAGWTEFTDYVGTRKTVSFGSPTLATPSVATSALSQFAINAGGTVGGAFLCTVASGTSGKLISASSFITPGDRTVVSSDIITVAYTFSLDAM